MNIYACEIEADDRLDAHQTFKVADDSGLNKSGEDVTLTDTSWYVETDAEDAGVNPLTGREQVTFNIRPREYVGYTHKIIADRARIVRVI